MIINQSIDRLQISIAPYVVSESEALYGDDYTIHSRAVHRRLNKTVRV